MEDIQEFDSVTLSSLLKQKPLAKLSIYYVFNAPSEEHLEKIFDQLSQEISYDDLSFRLVREQPACQQQIKKQQHQSEGIIYTIKNDANELADDDFKEPSFEELLTLLQDRLGGRVGQTLNHQWNWTPFDHLKVEHTSPRFFWTKACLFARIDMQKVPPYYLQELDEDGNCCCFHLDGSHEAECVYSSIDFKDPFDCCVDDDKTSRVMTLPIRNCDPRQRHITHYFNCCKK